MSRHTCILVQDSEADINELLCEDRSLDDGRQLHLIVRGGQVRTTSAGKLIDVLRDQPVRIERALDVSGRTPRAACTPHNRERARKPRTDRVEIRATTVELCRSRGSAKPTYGVVLAEESNTPSGNEPIQWVLITSLPVDNIQQIQQVIQASQGPCRNLASHRHPEASSQPARDCDAFVSSWSSSLLALTSG